jgi:hypothetical protein
MSDMGLGDFCQSVRGLDVALLIEQFTALEHRKDEIRRSLASKNLAAARRLDRQFAMLSGHLFPLRNRGVPRVPSYARELVAHRLQNALRRQDNGKKGIERLILC